MMGTPTYDLTIRDLCRETGLSRRVIRSWIERDLLPGASGRGSGARYTHAHLDRLRCIQAIRDAAPSLGLDEVRQILLSLDDDRIRAIGAGDEPVVAMPVGLVEPVPGGGIGSLPTGPRRTDAAPSPPRASDASPAPASGDSALDYIRRVRQESRGTVGPATRLAWGHDRASAPSRLDRLVDALRHGAGTEHVKPAARAEMWASIPITPDIELRARGLDDHDLQRLERAADLLRAVLMRDAGPDPRAEAGPRPAQSIDSEEEDRREDGRTRPRSKPETK